MEDLFTSYLEDLAPIEEFCSIIQDALTLYCVEDNFRPFFVLSASEDP